LKEAEIATLDVGVIGGGICGASVAAFLAEEGLNVGLFERASIASAASGRNSGVIQHPFDPHLAALHRESLTLYRTLALEESGFELAEQPVGLLVVSPDADAVAGAAASVVSAAPELQPELIDPAVLRTVEPMLAPDLTAFRMATGYPVAPAVATRSIAERARRAGASLVTDAAVDPNEVAR
jgi:glycine/D-amino acid oxidase-like deaminating enzyme